MVSRANVIGPNMEWQKTTLRKGTKSPKICRDMFITESRGEFEFAEVKNGSISFRKKLTCKEASEIIKAFGLVSQKSIFAGSYTYRDKESKNLVKKILMQSYASAFSEALS